MTLTLKPQMEASLGLQIRSVFTLPDTVTAGCQLTGPLRAALLMQTEILALSIPAVVVDTKMGYFLGTDGFDLTLQPLL